MLADDYDILGFFLLADGRHEIEGAEGEDRDDEEYGGDHQEPSSDQQEDQHRGGLR